MDNTAVEMPRYKCHKEVWALKIKDILREPGQYEPSLIVPEEEAYAPFLVPAAYVAKHNPQIGGYYVVYSDGYESFSPADAFESGYSRI